MLYVGAPGASAYPRGARDPEFIAEQARKVARNPAIRNALARAFYVAFYGSFWTNEGARRRWDEGSVIQDAKDFAYEQADAALREMVAHVEGQPCRS